MIQNIKITNSLGESITIGLENPEQSGFFIKSIEGLGPPKATINSTEVLNIDGSVFNSSRLSSRNLVFTIGFLENPTIEDSRLLTYKFFPIKEKIEVVVTTDNREVKIDGYVESNEPDIFSKTETTKISVICPFPFFSSLEDQISILNLTQKLFSFPFSNESLVSKLIVMGNLSTTDSRPVEYFGDTNVGLLITIRILQTVSHLRLYNETTNEVIGIDSVKLVGLTGADLSVDDVITISTIKGNKYISLLRNNAEINILGCLMSISKWIQLRKGINVFSAVGADNDPILDSISVTIENKILYTGV